MQRYFVAQGSVFDAIMCFKVNIIIIFGIRSEFGKHEAE